MDSPGNISFSCFKILILIQVFIYSKLDITLWKMYACIALDLYIKFLLYDIICMFDNKQNIDPLRTRNQHLVTMTSRSIPTTINKMSTYILHLSCSLTYLKRYRKNVKIFTCGMIKQLVSNIFFILYIIEK